MSHESFKPEDDYAPLSDYQIHLINKFGRNMGEWPPEFWAAVKSKLEVDPPTLLVSDIPSLKGEEWREIGATGQPAFAGTWTNSGGNTIPARFYKDALGMVHLEGHIKSGGANLMFTLPEGYRPSGETHFACKSWNGAAEVYGAARVLANGQVELVAGNSNDFSLATIHFRAA